MLPLELHFISSIICLVRSGNSLDTIHFFVEGRVVEYDVAGKPDSGYTFSPALSLMELAFSEHISRYCEKEW